MPCIRYSPKPSGLTQNIIGAAIEVHRDKGPGLVESIYEWCLTTEFDLRHMDSLNQKLVKVSLQDLRPGGALCVSTCW